LLLEGANWLAHKGDGFRISTAVRDRMPREDFNPGATPSWMTRSGPHDIVEQKVHTMMAAASDQDRIIGLIYGLPFVLREFTGIWPADCDGQRPPSASNTPGWPKWKRPSAP
jgi:hypothetical protein